MNGLLNPWRGRLGALAPAAVRAPLARMARSVGLLTEPPPIAPEPETAPRFPVRYIMIGTTNVCNASCIHCPTNKLETDHVLRGVMSMAMFRSLIDQLADEAMVEGFIALGVHGDGLVDPLVVERARYVHEKLPNVVLHVNTNGAAYNRAKHKALADYVHVLSLHTESLIPEVYNRILAPLRLERVGRKMDMILEDFGLKTFVSVPVSRLNIDELPVMEKHFLSRGASAVLFAPITNRCSPDSSPNRAVFKEMSFAPVPGSCPGNITRDLIIDWDGKVMLCCNDFAKEFPIGDFARESLKDLMHNAKRAEVMDMLDAGRWADIPTCARCQFDCNNERTAVAEERVTEVVA